MTLITSMFHPWSWAREQRRSAMSDEGHRLETGCRQPAADAWRFGTRREGTASPTKSGDSDPQIGDGLPSARSARSVVRTCRIASPKTAVRCAATLSLLVSSVALPFLAGCSEQAPAGVPSEVVVVTSAALPEAPGDEAWKDAPSYPAALVVQDMVEPRLLEPTTDQVLVKAVSDGKQLVMRLEWVDPTQDDLPRTGQLPDGCAVQLPARVDPNVPAPQMGEPGHAVEITYWRASWQAVVDGREDSIRALYPRAAVDHYPFQAGSLQAGSPEQEEAMKRYAPARGLGNVMAGPRDRPVQDLVAEGPGTIRPAAKPQSTGSGQRTSNGWAVVLSRPLPPGLEPGSRTQVAFAVWQGANDEAGARKMRSVWIPLHFLAPSS